MIIFSNSSLNATQSSANCSTVRFIIPLVGNGGSSVFEYQVIYWKSGGSREQMNVKGQLVFISNLEGGNTYSIRVRSKNLYGYGPLSHPFTVKMPTCSSMCYYI